jgi:GT2 family glycosyltransferase
METLKKNVEIIRASGLFDSEYYLQQYPDVAALSVDPIEHFVMFGGLMLRNPNPGFNTKNYLSVNPNLDVSKVNPLVHYASRVSAALAVQSNPAAPEAANDAPSEITRPIRGFFDRLNDHGLAGWAIDPGKPGKPVPLTMFIDGVRFMDFQTNEPRNDVSAKGLQGGTAGFSATWPAGLFNEGAEVEIRHTETGQPLAHSPRRLMPSAVRSERTDYLDAVYLKSIRPLTVIVPVYNAHDAVADCLRSMTQYNAAGVEVLLINDCSTDERIRTLLEGYRASAGYRVCHNEVNLGYTRSVNKAIDLCAGRDVILLNSDTTVTERWIENLRYCAYASARVATVTAMSDNAGAFSSPEIGVYNPLPSHLSQSQFALAITNAAKGKALDVPTGNGFCLYIRRAVLDDIGAFDEAKFPRGYGEENDFCMRAVRRGWRNVVCDKAYVFHKRSQSFQGEKVGLMKAGGEVIDRDYPEYRLLTRRFRDVEFSLVRHRARAALADTASAPLKRVLYVISTQTGGTPQTNMDLMRSLDGKYECLLLRCDAKTITLSILRKDKLDVVETHHLARPIEPITHRSDEYDRVVMDMMYRHSITLLHIRHIGWHSLGLVDSANALSIPVVYSVHDFYSVCPSLNLLDENLNYCGGKCTAGNGTCQIGLWPVKNVPALKHQFVTRWQEMLGEFIEKCDHVITTAYSAGDILASTYPAVRSKLTVIPHGRDFAKFDHFVHSPEAGEKIRVLVPGNITLSKGARLIKELAELAGSERFELHFLGTAWEGIKHIGTHHGAYDRASFTEKVAQIAPHFGVIFSICPETYCHTLTEMWACALPVLALDIGAVGDRVRASKAGWLMPTSCTASELQAEMNRIVDDRAEFDTKVSAALAWQRSEGMANTIGAMSLKYRDIYRQLLDKGAMPHKKLALVIKGERAHPATAHIRVLRPLSAALDPAHVDTFVTTASWLNAGGFGLVDAVLVQRDAMRPEHVDEFIRTARASNVPYIYEIDDWLWNLPAEHTDHSIDARQCEAMLQLVEHAAIVTTSTNRLAEELGVYAKRVEVIPNALDEALWTAELPKELVASVQEYFGFRSDQPNLLYMGTASHASDLQMIAPALQLVREKAPTARVLQIGGGMLLPGAIGLKVPKEYSSYPKFVQWFRAVCTFVTLGIAPLRGGSFNSAKSDIKSLDYGLAQVPAVFSNVAPYTDSIQMGETGLLADNTYESWTDAVMQLLTDPTLRAHIREGAFNAAHGRTLRQGTADHWRSVLAELNVVN